MSLLQLAVSYLIEHIFKLLCSYTTERVQSVNFREATRAKYVVSSYWPCHIFRRQITSAPAQTHTYYVKITDQQSGLVRSAIYGDAALRQ